jgi:hypothetical protein
MWVQTRPKHEESFWRSRYRRSYDDGHFQTGRMSTTLPPPTPFGHPPQQRVTTLASASGIRTTSALSPRTQIFASAACSVQHDEQEKLVRQSNMMDGYAKCSDLKTAAAVPAVDKDDDDAAGMLLVATPVSATSTERVEVIAPASLPGGYELSCDFCGRSVLVRVVRGVAFRGSRGSSPFLHVFDSTTIANR